MFTTRIRLCLGLLFGALSGLTASATPPAALPPSAEVQPDQFGDTIYVLFYREGPSELWFEWLVYTDLGQAEEQAKKFREAGCETLIRTRVSN